MVDEQTQTAGEKSNNPNGNSEPGRKLSGSELLERTRAEREGLAKENERFEKNIKELKELEAARLLGSTAGGRVEIPQPSEEDLKKKEALNFWKGTQIADIIAKNG